MTVPGASVNSSEIEGLTMSLFRKGSIAASILCALCAWGQPAAGEPHIGYLYPAGGQAGEVTHIAVGGQSLRGAKQVLVSGEGVHAEVIQFFKPVRNIQKEQRDELIERMTAVRDARLAKMKGQSRPPAVTTAHLETGGKATFQPLEHPLLYDLENKSLRELAHIRSMLFFPREKRQLNVQIAETVLIKVTIDPDAAPGDRELRLEAAGGLTNPMLFQVGQFQEMVELEPNEPGADTKLPKAPPVNVPFVMNGQVMPGDVDRFPFRAKRGQSLVIEVAARHLIPYLADAVPGWFQSVVTVYDAQGREVAFADDYRFNPDPVLLFIVPEDGAYELDIHDSVYRGREDFVYRVTVSERPFITSLFPLGAPADSSTSAWVTGWNLARRHIPLDTKTAGDAVRYASLQHDATVSNAVAYAVDTLPERAEVEPNDSDRTAIRIELPQIVNGTIGEAGDVDMFRFGGQEGDVIVTEIIGRRLGSPLDSLLRLTDAFGQLIEWNDDYVEVESGLNTHHADSYLRTQLPDSGDYLLAVSDSQRHGGEAFAYRLRVSEPQPDFALRMTPSSLNARAGRAVPITVYAFRKDGFDGDIEIAMQDAPPGFTLQGARIPAGCDRIRMTISAPHEASPDPVALRLVGRAWVASQPVTERVVPAEDMMQAFLYRHLVPAEELLVLVLGGNGRQPFVELAGSVPLQIPSGGSALVRVRTPKGPALSKVQLALSDPPQGVTLGDLSVVPPGLEFSLKAEGEAAALGFTDNLIVEAFADVPARQGDGKPTNQNRRVSLGYLPAIPIEIVAP
jgi:hypothetical protein